MLILGFGRMGRRFTKLFAEDFDVQVASSRDVSDEVRALGARPCQDVAAAVAASAYVFLAVPLAVLPEAIEQIRPHLKPSTTVLECCSARVAAERIVSTLPCNHVGLHDVHPPRYACFGTPDPVLRAFFEQRGIPLEPMTAEDHDRHNAVTGLSQFLGLVLDRHLSPGDREILSKSRTGSPLLEIVRHMSGNAAATYLETQMDNPFTDVRRAEFIRALEEVHRDLEQGRFPT